MTDQQLRRALRDLPRHGASDGFTRRTVARLEESLESEAEDGAGRRGLAPEPRWTLPRAAAAAALVLAAVGALTLAPVLLRHPATPPSASSPGAPQGASSSSRTGLSPSAGVAEELPADLGTSPAAEPSPAGPTAGTVRSPQRLAELAELRAERDRLADELQALRRQIRPGPAGAGAAVPTAAGLHPEPTSGDPLIYLGGDDRVDLVLDLGRLAAERGDGSATYRPGAPPGGSS